jgi:hypothetical protein
MRVLSGTDAEQIIKTTFFGFLYNMFFPSSVFWGGGGRGGAATTCV